MILKALIFLGCLLLAAPVLAQDDDVVKVKANLVNIDVIVKDKKGKYISDLKAEDFTITENGVAQKVEFFDAPLARSTDTTQPGTSPGPTTAPRNYVSLVLDSLNTDLANFKQVREGAVKYVREHVTDADAVAVFMVTNGLQMLQPFTQDKAELIAALENAGTTPNAKNFEQRDIANNIASLQEFLKNADSTPTTAIGSTGAGSNAARIMIARNVLQQFYRLRTALSLQQSRPILAALAAIAEALKRIPGKKTLVMFSQGFVTPEVLDWQVQSTI
ncbi:MAG TPA: VWA domain-containing protein, partial [Pyrinomonadaceae bacterium]|nr:VWA domain-containing protein [Pyrinomonadaceae bacterium]